MPTVGPGVGEVIGDDQLVEVGRDGDVELHRPARPGRALLVLHQRSPDPAALLDEADRLAWLAGRGPAPAVIAAGRSDAGDETLVVRLGVDAAAATVGHPMGPEALIAEIAAGLRELHAIDVDGCPFTSSTDELRAVVAARLAGGEIPTAADGPYVGRAPEDLAALFDELTADLGPGDSPVFIHGGLNPERVWFDPSGTATFTGWSRGGVGDRHLDLAAAAGLATSLYGPALVAPLFDQYGLETVDLRRLDAHQLLAHLLA